MTTEQNLVILTGYFSIDAARADSDRLAQLAAGRAERTERLVLVR